MDQVKIGKFIAECRKSKNLTQSQLAEKLFITDRAVSKWENGRGMPDSSLMLDLCKVLDITVIELLNGEKSLMEKQKETQEQIILDMVKQKQESDKRLLMLEIVIVALSVAILIITLLIATFIDMETWAKVLVICAGFITVLIGCAFALKIEQVAGYYKCAKCGYTYVPIHKAFYFAPHMGRTRYLKCPRCGQKSWNKKVIEK